MIQTPNITKLLFRLIETQPEKLINSANRKIIQNSIHETMTHKLIHGLNSLQLSYY